MSLTNQKGDIGEAAFVFEAVKKGYWVAKMPQDCPYDYILDRKDGKLLRVQCKYRQVKCGSVKIRREHKTFANRTVYTATNIDVFAVYVPDTGQVSLIPVSVIQDNGDASFRVEKAKNNMEVGIRMMTPYLIW